MMFSSVHRNAIKDAVTVGLNTELARLMKRMPSTTQGIEAGDLIERAYSSTNERFKRDSIRYVRKSFEEYLK